MPMPNGDHSPLHDLADRLIRQALQQPGNLRDLLTAVLPTLAPSFDCERATLLDREFFLDDWRRRVSDLLFLVPYHASTEEETALVCVLIEHQSRPDLAMPLRLLVYAALYWEREWRAWEAQHERGQALRLSPIIPIVLYTGLTPWRTHRELADLIGGPESVRRFTPIWKPLFWEVTGHATEELLQATGAWLQALAVVRAERDDTEAFLATMGQALRQIQPLSSQEPVRWHELLRFILSWALYRRPQEEQEQLITAARASQEDVGRQQEVETMSKTIAEWLIEQGEARGEAQGQLRAYQESLRALLEERFGVLPAPLVQRLEATTDVERLKACLRAVLRVHAVDDLPL